MEGLQKILVLDTKPYDAQNNTVKATAKKIKELGGVHQFVVPFNGFLDSDGNLS